MNTEENNAPNRHTPKVIVQIIRPIIVIVSILFANSYISKCSQERRYKSVQIERQRTKSEQEEKDTKERNRRFSNLEGWYVPMYEYPSVVEREIYELQTKIEWEPDHAITRSAHFMIIEPDLGFDIEPIPSGRVSEIKYDFWFGKNGTAQVRTADGKTVFNCEYLLVEDEKVIVREITPKKENDENRVIYGTFMLLKNGLFSFDYQKYSGGKNYIFKRSF